MENKNLNILNELDDLEKYMRPFETEPSIQNINPDLNIINEEKNNSNTINKSYEQFTIQNLKEKYIKVYDALQLYISQKNQQLMINYLSIFNNNQNISENIINLINNLLDILIELITKKKDEEIIKESLLNKVEQLKHLNDDYEKKLNKSNKEIQYKQKEINKIINQSNIDKEKIKDNQKTKNLEINELKNENRKLSNRINLYISELKKKNLEHQKLIDKLKNNYTKNNHIQFKNSFDITASIDPSSDEFYNKILNENNKLKINENIENLKQSNFNLLNLLKEINNFLNQFFNIVKFNENKNIADNYFEIKNNAINSNLLNIENYNVFKENLLANFKIVFFFILQIKKNYNNLNYTTPIKNNNINDINKKVYNTEPIQKNIKNNDNINNKMKFNLDDNDIKKELNPKWYDHLKNEVVNYEYDKNNVITENSEDYNNDKNCLNNNLNIKINDNEILNNNNLDDSDNDEDSFKDFFKDIDNNNNFNIDNNNNLNN